MARKMRSDPEADKTAASIKRKNADARFAKTQKKPDAPLLEEPKTHLALPSDEAYTVQMAKVLRAKKAYEKAKADAKSASADAKARYDDAKTSAVAALVGRSVSRTSFERMIILETRRAAKGEEEVTAEIKGEVWMLAAGGFQAAEQINLPFDGESNAKNQKQLLARAKKQGIEAGVNAVSLSANPFHPGESLGQAWLEGYHEGQAANAGKIGQTPKPTAKVTSLADVKAKRAKVQEKRGALPAAPVVAGETPVKRGRGRPPKAKAPKEGDITDTADDKLKDAAE